jgi:hypothetical protein
MPPLFPYSSRLLISIGRTVTKERLTRYLKATAQDLPQALQLYEYNIALSEVLYGLLHGLEVAVRNVEHDTLAASYATPAWYDKAQLPGYWRDQVQEAKKKLGPGTAAVRVVPELTFAFWVDLLSRRNHNTLWVGRRLNTAFPNTTLSRDAIHRRLKTVQLLRNRTSPPRAGIDLIPNTLCRPRVHHAAGTPGMCGMGLYRYRSMDENAVSICRGRPNPL